MKLPELNDSIQLVSVDIFDTLLLRTVAKPIDIFEQVWREAVQRGIAHIAMTPKEYVKLRVEMERRARLHAKNREVTLKEIYAQYPAFIAKDIGKLQKLELEIEKNNCYRNDTVWKWLSDMHDRGVKIVLVSDMYLTGDEIVELLKASGIDTDIFDRIIVSNEYGCNKQNGELFSVLFETYPTIPAEAMLHIGDNKSADYEQPIKRGMNAFHYNAVPDCMNSVFEYEKIRHNIPLPELLSLRKTDVWNSPYEGMEHTAYELGNTVIGPVLSLYVTWVCKRLKQLGIKRIYPLMREGYLLGELLKKEAEHIQYPLEVHPIYISRKVTYIPSIKVVNQEEIENMIGARNLTIRESVALMGLEEEAFSDMEEYLDIQYKQTHQISYEDGTLKDYVIRRFLEPCNVEKIEAYIRRERKKLVQYLIQEMGDMLDVATIDIGFFGRIQMWMEECLDLEKIPHRMTHFLAVGVTGDKVYDGYHFEGYFGTYGENTDLIPTIHRTTDVIEKLISVTEGSTIGYREAEGKIVPIQAEGVNNAHYTDISFEGTFAFQNRWLGFRSFKEEIAKCCVEKSRETLMILHRLIDMPRLEEAELMAGFEADTNFGTNYKKGIITKEHLALAKEKGLDFIDKCNVSYTYHNSYVTWPKGTVTLLDSYYYVRKALKNGTQNEIIKSMQEVVERVQEDNVKQVALYGAGENGRQFYFLCQMYNIPVTCFIDRKESIWGTFKEGVEVMGLDEAMNRGNDTYIVTSLFSISEISDYIRERYKNLDKEAVIYSV